MAWMKKMTLVDFQYMIDGCRENPALVPEDARGDAVCNCKDGTDEPPGSCMDIESIIGQFTRALQQCEENDGGGGDIFFQVFTGGVLIGGCIAGGYWLYKQWKKRRDASLLPIRQDGEQQQDGGNKLVGKADLLTPGEIELRSRPINPADIPLPESIESSMENLVPPTSPVSVDSGTSSSGSASPHAQHAAAPYTPPPAPK